MLFIIVQNPAIVAKKNKALVFSIEKPIFNLFFI